MVAYPHVSSSEYWCSNNTNNWMTFMSIIYKPIKNQFHMTIIAKLWPMKFVMYNWYHSHGILCWNTISNYEGSRHFGKPFQQSNGSCEKKTYDQIPQLAPQMWSCFGLWILVRGANTLWYEYIEFNMLMKKFQMLVSISMSNEQNVMWLKYWNQYNVLCKA